MDYILHRFKSADISGIMLHLTLYINYELSSKLQFSVSYTAISLQIKILYKITVMLIYIWGKHHVYLISDLPEKKKQKTFLEKLSLCCTIVLF